MQAADRAPARGPLLALLGPTASGKTEAAVALARVLPVEVVAADSRQLRRGMRIGTAAPSDAELDAVPHHVVGIVEPDAPWTLADWLQAARAAIASCHERGRLPLLVAGTGQYAWALLEGWRVPAVPPDPVLRAELEALAARAGVQALGERLARVDPASATRIGERNARRLMRAMEIVETTGAPVPPLERGDPGVSWRAVGLRRPRSELYARADERAASIYAGGENSLEMIGRAAYTGGQWPPTDITPFSPWSLPFLNTLILLTSGTTVTWAHHALRTGNRRTLIHGLWLTVLLGVSFTGIQAYEYVHASFTMDGGIYGSTFFMATGFHGAHVIIGTCFLMVCLIRAYKGHFTPDHHFGFEAAAWYWHFVDVVWLFLFTFVYWWASGGATARQ